MNAWRYITRSLSHYRWTHLSVLLAVAVTSAVLTGALIVGDSVRGSLRQLTLERLGKIDFVLVTDRFFRAELVEELKSSDMFDSNASSAVPACVVSQVTIERSNGQSGSNSRVSRARNVTLVGCDEGFWGLDSSNIHPEKLPELGEVILNENLANAINAKVGDEIVLRLPDANQVPADSPLGRQEGRLNNLPSQRVIEILPNRGLARFSLHPSQQYANNAFVSIEAVQQAIDQTDRINAILAASPTRGSSVRSTAEALTDALSPKLEDYGLTVVQNRMTFPADSDNDIWNYFHITSDQLMLGDIESVTISKAISDLSPQVMFTYLATRIAKVSDDQNDAKSRASAGVPYSTVLAVNNNKRLGPLVKSDTTLWPLANGQIALNNWTAEQLEVEIGDRISLTFFEPETTHGNTVERTETFELSTIVPLTQPATRYIRKRKPRYDQRPTMANDAGLTPTVEGITDQESIDDWDPPFPFEQSRIKPADDEYWEFHRTTPKAFISLADGQRLWASRFGKATSFRIPADVIDADQLESRISAALAKRNAELGFAFRPVKETSLLASKGTTPFEYLFIGFSFFLIASALMLVAILFRLTVELRASSLGSILASGWDTATLRRATVTELAIVAVVGSGVGVLGGVLYADIMLAGLRNLWVAAIVTPFLRLHVSPNSIVVGFAITAIIAILVVWFSLRRLGDSTILDLLAGRLSTSNPQTKKSFRGWLPPTLAIVAVILALVAIGLSGEAQAGAFFGSGSMILTAGLLMIRATLYRQGTTAASQARISPLSLAWRSATRNPDRSTLTIGLMAAATFLIIAIAAFRLAPTESGTGGFQLLADSDRPLFIDFRDKEQVVDAFGNQSPLVENATILPMRVQQGDDASCRNLYQATRPTLLGVTPAMLDYFESDEHKSAWSSIDWSTMQTATMSGEPIPVILDKNTAMYSLHLPPSLGHEFTLDFDPPIRFRIAGLLSNTTMQGSLIVPEADLLRLFPDTAGFQKFLIKSDEPSKVSDLLEERFGDEGLDVVRSTDVLSGLLAVQNTYLSTFQSLGALGLLLGTLGLAAVQIRNVLTRRGELALLSAIGYSQSAVRRQLIWENASLLLAGLGIGTTAALVVVIPHAIFGDASLPLTTITVTLSGILALGLFAGVVTSRFALRTPILAALREE